MFLYYIRLSLLSYRRNPILSSLMVLAIAIGISAYMVIYTLNYVMGGNPIPHKSDQLFHVQLEAGNPNTQTPADSQLTWLDATALTNADNAYRQTASSKFSAVLEPQGEDARPFSISGRGNLADFFPMFDVPFLYGNSWDSGSDENLLQVAVISKTLNERLFGGADSVGENIRLQGFNFEVVGVIDSWNPVPQFYDVNNSPFGNAEEVFVPWNLTIALEFSRSGNTNCWKPLEGDGLQAFLNSECTWVQYWVELRDSNEEAEYLNFLNNYATQQRQLGRFQRAPDNALFDVEEWLIKEEVLPDESQILGALATMLLAVCLLNTIGLLLSKFLGKSAEIGVRQALGAHKRSLFLQHVIEAGFIGLMGGILGLGLTALGLEGIKILLGDLVDFNWLQLDLSVVVITILLAIFSTIFAGLYPIWRACNINPAMHLKTQ